MEEAPRSSALLRHLKPTESQWDANSHLLAAMLDTLNGANWQRAGDKKAPKPDPVPRPNDGPKRPSIEPAPENGVGNLFGLDSFEPDELSLDEIDAWLGRAPADT